MLTILHYGHFSNAKCRKLFLYFFAPYIYIYIYIYIYFFFFFFFFFLHFANATCRNSFFFYNFYILRGVIPYCEKTPFQTTLFEIFMKIIYLFSHFCRFRYMYWVIWVTRSALKTIPFYSVFWTHMQTQETSEWVRLGDTENHYETRFWCAVDFNTKVHLVHQVQLDFRWPVAVFTF